MNCLDENELARWVDGRLPSDRARLVEAHLSECPMCRLLVESFGEGAGGDSEEDPAEALARFKTLLPRLEAAWREPDERDDSDEDDRGRIRMAADTAARSEVTAIPSVYAEDATIVVAFHVDPGTRSVSAHLVSRDPERIAFRALAVGGTMFVTNRSGEVELSGLSPDEVLGLRIGVPGRAGSWEGDLVPGPARRLELQPEAGREACRGSISARMLKDGARFVLEIESERRPPDVPGVVVVSDDDAARFVPVSDEGRATCILGTSLPTRIRLTMVAPSQS